MEIGIVSREMIKPFSISSVNKKSPFKISLLDQLTPSTYSPIILFYPSNDVSHFKSATHRLKTSLSQTLTRFYPLSGRLKDNLFMDSFDQGVPYVESRVPCEMSQFLRRQPQMECLNDFLPCRPYAPEPNPATMPPMGVQVNVFDCGGIAVGISMSHKLMDGAIVSYFLKCWAAAACGRPKQISTTDGSVLEAASLLFPPVNPLPRIYERMRYDRWFGQGNLKVRRFVFDEEAVAGLRAKARSEYVTNPTRSEALSSLIWKCATSASATGCPDRISVLSQAVNLRPRAKPPISDATIGNVFWSAVAATRGSERTELPMLVKLGRESVEAVDSEFIRSLQGDYRNKLGSEGTKEDTEMYGCTSWFGIGLEKIDFGWGVPIWVGAFGEFSWPFANTIMLKKINASEKGIEAWVALPQNVMDVMEKDPDFLAYASLNPPVVSLFP